MSDGKLIFRVHAVERMFQRSIDEEDVREALEAGEVIEDYPDDTPYPSRLILGWAGARPLHVVVALNSQDNERIIITVYVPDPKHWEPGYRRRRL
jgi:hypothetical protein